jgi:citrate synthase
MDNDLSKIRTLLYIVLVLALLAVCTNIYVGTQLSQNSDELAKLGVLVHKEMMGSATEEAKKLDEKMDKLTDNASNIDARMQKAQDEMDAKMQKAQDEMVARMKIEIPKILDNYLKSKAPEIQRRAMEHAQQ